MKRRSSKRSIARSIMVLGATLSLIGGATFAALKSQEGIIKGNTIQTALASLQVSNNNSTYASTIDGFAFSNLVPGGQPSPTNGYPVFVKNVGTTPLSLSLSVGSSLVNTDNINLSKVHVILLPNGGGAGQNVTLAELVSSATTGGIPLTISNRLVPSQSAGFTLQVSLEADAVTGPSANVSNVDFNFGALAVN